MFEHSVRVPRLYKTAATILKKVKNEGASLKGLVLQRKFENIKGIYALVCETLQRQSDIDFLLEKSKLLEKESRFEPFLARILITELLWGKKKLAGESIPIKTILSYKQTLLAHSNELDEENRLKVEKPRYVRVNTLKLSTNEAVNGFRDEGWILSKFVDTKDYEGFLGKLSNLQEDEFMVDFHFKELLIFPKKTQFYSHSAYLDSSIILQDKASCLPVKILNPPPGSIVLDMCAAPGMKTTQMAALMENKGTLFAVERDLKRVDILKSIVEKSGATCVKILNKDVLTVSDKEVPGVEYILVDPSCSGSGMLDRVKSDAENKNPERIQQLARFQISILKHALRNFPDCKRVVYSTCSMYPEENEEVVKEVISSNTKYKLVSAQELLGGTWFNLGSSEYGDLGKLCLNANPKIDMTNGFFVAVFERLLEGETNEFYNVSNSYNYKNDKKRKMNQNGETDEDLVKKQKLEGENKEESEVVDISEKKKTKKKVSTEEEMVDEICSNKKSKKMKSVDIEHSGSNDESLIPAIECENSNVEKTKKKKKKNKNLINVEEQENNTHVSENNGVNDSKKKNNINIEHNDSIDKSLIQSMECENSNVVEKKKKKKNKNLINIDEEPEDATHVSENNGVNDSKKKKNINIEHDDSNGLIQSMECENSNVEKKKKKKIKNLINVEEEQEDDTNDSIKKKKKKSNTEMNTEIPKKKKNKHCEEVDNEDINVDVETSAKEGTKKKSKSKKNKDIVETDVNETIAVKKSKKKRKLEDI